MTFVNFRSHFAPKNCGCVWKHLSAFLVRVSKGCSGIDFFWYSRTKPNIFTINFGGRVEFCVATCSVWDCSFLCVLQHKKFIIPFRFISSVFEKKPDYLFCFLWTLRKVFLNLYLYFLSLLSLRWCIFQSIIRCLNGKLAILWKILDSIPG
jgi:hypothetical protein